MMIDVEFRLLSGLFLHEFSFFYQLNKNDRIKSVMIFVIDFDALYRVENSFSLSLELLSQLLSLVRISLFNRNVETST